MKVSHGPAAVREDETREMIHCFDDEPKWEGAGSRMIPKSENLPIY